MSTDAGCAFEGPADAPREMEAIAYLSAAVDQLRVAGHDVAHHHFALKATVDKLTADHAALRKQVQKSANKSADIPPSVRWDALDRDAAAVVWAWLIDRVHWLVERYGLHEDLGQCWPQHPALVEELTALCLAWHAAYDGGTGEAPLRWHEAFDRARRRWHDWDRHTKCRLGQHREAPNAAVWSADWLQGARDVARRDAGSRPRGADQDNREQVGG